MANDTVYVDSLVAWAKGPIRVRGTLAVGNWREPAINLFLRHERRRAVQQRSSAKIRLDAGLALSGPFDNAYLSGAIVVTQGVVYAPEPTGRHIVGAGDPALFNVLDTAIVTERDLFPPISPFLANLRVDVSLDINHNMWVRNREANIEIYTDDPLSIHEEGQSLSITGVRSRPIAANTTSSASDFRSSAARRCSSADPSSIRRCRSPANIRCRSPVAVRSTFASRSAER